MLPYIRRSFFGASVCLITLSASAQTTTARVSGTVTDNTGAVIQGATILAHNLATNEDRSASTGSEGSFTMFSLPPNDYSLRVSAPGFATTSLPVLHLRVGQEFVWTPTLAVSSEGATVTVNADTVTLLDTSSARIGAVVPTREIQELPINGRQVSQLYLLTPGATNTGTGTFDNIHFSGRAVEQNIIRLDGIEATSLIDTSPGNLNGELTSLFRLQQSLEAVQEFRVDSSSYPAEMGTGTGGQISFITKSGTNQLHGSVFEYLRNDYFDARNYFNRKNVANNPTKFRLNQFGGSLGGPLFTNKLFAFGTYEGLRQNFVTPYTQSTLSNYAKSLVPSTAAIYSLLGAYPNDPNSIASEAPVTTLDAQGNVVVTKAPVLTTAVTVIGPNRVQEDFGMLRLDYKFSDRFAAYARYNRDQGVSSQTQDASLSRFGQVEVPQNAVLALNQAWTGSIFNETKVGFNGVKMRVQGLAGPSPSADLSASRIAVAGLTNVGSLISLSSSFNGIGAPYTGRSLNYIDNLSVVHGKHSMKFGAEVRPIYLYNNQLGGATYTYNSVGAVSYANNGGTVVASVTPGSGFLSNSPSQIQFYGNLSDLSPFTGLSGNAKVQQNYYIGYAQDEWRATPSLTINAGLRYEYFSPLHEARNKDVFFDMKTGTILPNYAGDWYHSSTKNFGPRLGITFAPPALHGKTVMRAGGGIFYGPGQTEDQIQPEANDRVSATFAASSGQVYPIIPANVYAGYSLSNPNLGYQPRAYAPGYSIPERVGTYTFSIEQQLPSSFELMVAYVGSVGRNLFLRSITNTITGVYENPTTGAGTAIRQYTVGAVPTTFGANGVITNAATAAAGTNRFAEIDYKTSGGHDSYNSLQSTLQRRVGNSLSFGAQYTFAKELGTSSGSNEANTAQNPFNFDTEFGRGTFDIRHTLNVTALYSLPFGHGKRFSMSGPMDELLGGMQIGGILNVRSGLPIDVLITRPDLAYVGNAGTPYAGLVYSSPIVSGGVPQTTAVVNVPGGGNSRNIRRPNIVPGVNPYLKSGLQYLNPAAFSTPAPGTFGNYRRNDLTGPGLTQFDLTLAKKFRITERANVEFKAEGFNVLNHPNFANPGNVRFAQALPSSATGSGIQPGASFTTANAGSNLGVISSTVGNQVGLGTNRQLQLSLRVAF